MIHTSGYLYIEPGSHMYDSLDQIINAIEMYKDGVHFMTLDYILTGVKNTRTYGYGLTAPTTRPRKECDAMEYCGIDCPGVDNCLK